MKKFIVSALAGLTVLASAAIAQASVKPADPGVSGGKTLLTAVLDPSSPQSGYVAPGTPHVAFTKVDLSASGGDITINKIVVVADSEIAGVSLENIQAVDSMGNVLGTVKSLTYNSNTGLYNGTIKLPSTIVIADGSTQVVTLFADVTTSARDVLRLGISAFGFANNLPRIVPALPLYGNYQSAS